MDSRRTTLVVGLMGSYHLHGTIDEAVEAALEGARGRGAATRKIVLMKQHIEFCSNCRGCTECAGPDRGHCPIEDDLDDVLAKLEDADGIVLAAPVNFGDVNALVRQLLERMVGYAYWPATARGPRLRSRKTTGRALLITSSAAPAIMTRTMARPFKTLRRMARLLGKRPCGTLVMGLQSPNEGPTETQLERARVRGAELADLSAHYLTHPTEPREHMTA
ncbi:NADPH-dependent FMN reductase [Planctomycetes bacterium Poly30]|uniref:NADPH-dependent FMN reductase n=1 Tax=Saltatorellus ferox TaxID=2528018 RepID=A0A518F0Q9_9BACT|nr:NADPH-dependent FMN reductase [Planctomycetes bacterium Poly30]